MPSTLNPLGELFAPMNRSRKGGKNSKAQARAAATNYRGRLLVPGLATLPEPSALNHRLTVLWLDEGKNGRKAVLAVLKKVLEAGHDEIREQFEQGRSGDPMGAICVRQHAQLADRVITAIFNLAFTQAHPLINPTDSERVSLVATGGYGRAELSPQSDIDLLFILPYKRTPVLEQGIEFILYMLWDLGLKVGQAVRSIDDCIRQAQADMTIRTTLLESRFLAGDPALFHEFRDRFDDEVVRGTANAFISAKLRERDERHHQMGDSRYVLEPNVKNGLGSLRDLHLLFWIAKYVHQVDHVHELVDLGVLNEQEAETFDRAQNFLWSVRAHLHYLTGRAEDRITFDLQPEVSRRLGYVDHGTTLGVERFMKHYFLVVKEVGALSQIFTSIYQDEAYATTFVRLGRSIWKREIEGFPLIGGRLNLPTERHFRDHPLDMIRLFRLAQQEGAAIHPLALQAMTRNLKLIGRNLRENPKADACFLEILMDPQAEETLGLMNDTGVLGRFLPDWARIVAQMQYDMYHVFTVDQHTLRAIGTLHRIARGELAEAYPLASDVFSQINSKRALFVAVLLHDIAKGRNGDHSILGEKVAQKLCPRLGLSEEETETVAWLVRWHLAMSQTALKRDLDDPKAIEDFVDLVQSIERLRLLLVLTTVDISAVGPGRWNGWKAGLLTRLFHHSARRLSPGDSSKSSTGPAPSLREELMQHLTDWPAERLDSFIEASPAGLWHAFDAGQIARFARFMHSTGHDQDELAIDTRIDRAHGYTEVAVITRDRKGLFTGLAGAIAASGATILDAKIFTFSDGCVLDVFAIQDLQGNPISSGDRLARLSVAIHRAVENPESIATMISARNPDLPKRADVFQVPPRVLVENTLSTQNTVIEVNGRDRPGLLYDLGRTLTEQGLQITSAKVTTYGEKAIDVFYVRDQGGLKITHEGKLEQIRSALLGVIEPQEQEQPGSYSASARRKERGSLKPVG